MNNLPCVDCGAPDGHSTRTIVFDKSGRMYVQIGSIGNIDEDSFRSRIRRFQLNEIPSGGFEYNDAEVYADGVRNEVALAFDKHGVLWGVENGADNLARSDLGEDIYNDNPAEEINKLLEPKPNTHYGYPYCFSEFNLPEDVALGKGTQWAWPTFLNKRINFDSEPHFLENTLVTDDFCRSESIIKPSKTLQAHSSSLGLRFAKNLDDARDPSCVGGFPKVLQNFAFIAYHGSWNREIPTGRKVVMLEVDENGEFTDREPMNIFCNGGASSVFDSGLRPVDVAFDECGRLYVTSDGTGRNGKGSKLFMITYEGREDVTLDEISSLVCLETSNLSNSETKSLGFSFGMIFLYFITLVVILSLVKTLKRTDSKREISKPKEKKNISL